jgi:uncharacterized protein (DUF2062 family)
MYNKLLEVWDWKHAVVGTSTSGVLVAMQNYFGVVGLLISIISATVTIILSTTKIIDWFERRREKKAAKKGVE